MKRSTLLRIATFCLVSMLLVPVSPALADDPFTPPDFDGDSLPNDMETSGWYSLGGGPFVTDPLDADTDDDGLSDGEEKLFSVKPDDYTSPGIYARYEDSFQTRQYFSATDPGYLSMAQGGGRYLMTEAMVLRRGTTFLVGGPVSATLSTTSDGLTALPTPERDPANGGWIVTIPSDAKTGTYTATLSLGGWSESMPLYVIFELPTPSPSSSYIYNLTEEHIDAFAYDDDPFDLRDETAVWFLAPEWSYYWTCDEHDAPCSDEQYGISRGHAQVFWTDQFKQYVFLDHTMPAIEGQSSQSSAVNIIASWADREFRTNYSAIQQSFSSAMYRWDDGTGITMWGGGCESNAGVFSTLLRSAGILARPFLEDYNKSPGHGESGQFNNPYQYDTSAMVWVDDHWKGARSYNGTSGGVYYPWSDGIVSHRELYRYYSDRSADLIISTNGGWDFASDGGMVNDTVIPGTQEQSGEYGHTWDYRWHKIQPLEIERSPYVDILAYQFWNGDNWAPSEWYTSDPDYPPTTTYSLPPGVPAYPGDLENWPDPPSTVTWTQPVAYYPVPTGCSPTTSAGVCEALLGIWEDAGGGGGGGGQVMTSSEVSLDPAATSETVYWAFLPLVASAPSPQVKPITLGQIVDNYGIDRDGNGRFDELIVEIQVDAAKAGIYQFGGSLMVGEGAVRSDDIRVYVGAQGPAQTVQISFNGEAIGREEIDGPYQLVQLWAAGPDQTLLRAVWADEVLDYQDAEYATAPYTAHEFEAPGALLSGDFAHQGADDDGDGYTESVVIDVGLDLNYAGMYRVEGDLYDGQGDFLGQATWMGTGSTALLEFSVTETSPPYSLEHLNLLDSRGRLLDSRYVRAYEIDGLAGIVDQGPVSIRTSTAQQTGDYSALDVRPTNSFTTTAVDADLNGLYEALVIQVGVEVVTYTGDYRIEGLLVDEYGTPVAWSVSDPQPLGLGNQTMRLTFDGQTLHDHMLLSPATQTFKLVAVKIYSGVLSPATLEDEVAVATTTPAYTRDDFEPASDAAVIFEDDMEGGANNWHRSPVAQEWAYGFDSDDEGFTYQDDAFGTSNPSKALGTYEVEGGYLGSGGVRVYLSHSHSIGASGGWQNDFTLAQDSRMRVTLRYRMRMGKGYETNEYGQALLDIDGTRYGDDTGTSLIRWYGDGNIGGTDDTGWLYDEFEVELAAGTHTITVGGYNNIAGDSNEWTEVLFDDITIEHLWSPYSDVWYSPSHTWRVRATDTVSASLAVTPTLDLSNYTSPAIRFRTAYSMESAGDAGYLELSDNGSSWTRVATFEDSTSRWATEVVDLSDWGETPDVQFRFTADAQSGLLWYVDDVHLLGWPVVTATYTYAPRPVIVGADTTFVASTSIVTAPVTYTWDFDGPPVVMVDTPTVTHQFLSADDHTVQLVVENSSDNAAYSEIVRVGEPITSTSFDFGPALPGPGDLVTFNAVYTPASATPPIAYTWDFGDDSNVVTVTTPMVSHSYSTSGDYDVKLTTSNIYGAALHTRLVTVNSIPVAEDDAYGVEEGQTLTVGAPGVMGNDTDADGDPITATLVGGPAHAADLTLNDDGSFAYTHDGSETTEDTFTYQVNDGNDDSNVATVAITIDPIDDPPIAGDDMANTPEDTPRVITVLGNDIDPEGGPLTVIAVGTPANGSSSTDGATIAYTPTHNFSGLDVFTYTIRDSAELIDTATITVDVGAVNDSPNAEDDTSETDEDTPVTIAVLDNDTDPDEDTLFVDVVGTPSHGSVRTDGATVTYTPTLDFYGSDVFSYTVSDGGLSDTATVTVTINPINDPPDAVDDEATTAEGALVSIDVLDNDSDAESEPLTITDAGLAGHGIVVFSSELVTYTPNADYFGSDSFTYTVGDGSGGSTMATVAITVTNVNDDPTANEDDVTIVEDSGPNVIDVLANDEIAPDVGETLTIIDISTTSHGTATFSSEVVTYTPDADYAGSDSLIYTISDGNGGSDTAFVLITVSNANDDPTANDDSATLAEDSGLNGIDVLANDDIAPDTWETLTVVAVEQGIHGTAAITGGGTGLTYEPDADYFGSDSFTYTVDDGNGGSATATVAVTVTNVNDDPAANDDNTTVIEDSGPNGIDVLANDDIAPDVGETLTIIGVGPAGHGAVIYSSDVVTYTPDADYAGSDSFIYTISDGNGGGATATVLVTVSNANDDPTANDDSATLAEDSGPNGIDVLTNDDIAPDTNETLTIVAVEQGSYGSAAITGGGTGLTYEPDADYFGTDSFTYTVDDSNGGSATATVAVTVTNINDDPAANDDNTTVVEDSGPNGIDVLANDDVAPDVGETLTIIGVGPAGHGAAIFGSDVVTYTPDADYSGPDSFTYTISDGNGGSATATVNVTVDNTPDAPEAVDDTATVDEDSGANVIDVVANDSDVDDDTLTITEVGMANHGTVTNNGADLAYTPAADYFGTDSFTYTVSDGNGGTATAMVDVTVNSVNDDPKAVDDNVILDEDSGANVLDVLNNDDDVEGDTLTITAAGPASHGTVTFSSDDITYTPDANYSGTDSFTYTISDGNGGTAGATVNVTVNGSNDAPEFSSTPTLLATVGVTYTYNIVATDDDAGDVLTITAQTLPGWLNLTDNGDGTAVISGMPLGEDVGQNSVELRVEDAAGAFAPQDFTIVVGTDQFLVYMPLVARTR